MCANNNSERRAYRQAISDIDDMACSFRLSRKPLQSRSESRTQPTGLIQDLSKLITAEP